MRIHAVDLITRFEAVGRAVVDRKFTHCCYPLGIGSCQPVDDVNIVCAFLKQKSCAVFLFGTPAAVITAAVTDKVTAPDCLDLSDKSGVDDLFHLEDKIHITHIVSDHQFAAGTVCRFKNVVASLNGNRQRFFKINSLARFKRGNGKFFMKSITDNHKNRFQFRIFEHFTVIGISPGSGKFRIRLFKRCKHFRIEVTNGNHLAPFAGKVFKHKV